MTYVLEIAFEKKMDYTFKTRSTIFEFLAFFRDFFHLQKNLVHSLAQCSKFCSLFNETSPPFCQKNRTIKMNSRVNFATPLIKFKLVECQNGSSSNVMDDAEILNLFWIKIKNHSNPRFIWFKTRLERTVYVAEGSGAPNPRNQPGKRVKLR